MVVRDDQSPRVKIEGPAHGAAQRYPYFRALPAAIEVLGDVEPFIGEEEDHHAFLTAASEPVDEVAAKGGRGRFNGDAQQRLPGGGFGQAAGAHDGGGDIGPALPRIGEGFGQSLERGGIDRAQGTKAANQLVGEILAPAGGIGRKERRQDG